MQDREPTDPVRAALSALMDGDEAAADQACRAWRGDAAARDDWHTYHLIGDLLRSDEHRCEPARDALFVASLRERLAQEPAVLAPSSVAGASHARARRLRAWMVPAAAAAGFVAVAGALVVMRVGNQDGAGSERVALGPGVPASSVARVSGAPGSPQAPSAQPALSDNATLIRSSELDRYLAAHRQYANSSTLAAPGGAVRSVSVAEPGR